MITNEEIIQSVLTKLQAEKPINEYYQLIINEAIKQLYHDRIF